MKPLLADMKDVARAKRPGTWTLCDQEHRVKAHKTIMDERPDEPSVHRLTLTTRPAAESRP
ncbi:hypothetical protein Ade02nite_24830 [Paractinoplanes deccanensis]|uniref:Uncharacterized protein n=1 Tax=Paractinoplanes deccanensis TaxID=113561 RepID=A0ABQ3Y1H9_9ACTN|nr:hypothetical protein Ade02nite_24830 [Actinoplanes deccanensis]